MDFVMMNQLPELAMGTNRIPHINRNYIFPVNKEKRNPYLSKWKALFDHTTDHWISCAPKIGKIIYPCFSCRDMFANKSSFLDHINRRSMIVKYYCTQCEKFMTFYNSCVFLLHCRNHFSDSGGIVDMERVDISTIPLDIAGFLPHPDYPRIFDVEDSTPNYNLNINVKFYRPKDECKGLRLLYFEGNELVFYLTNKNSNGINETQTMRLCQICNRIPKCEFVPLLAINITGSTIQTKFNNNNIPQKIKPVNRSVTSPVKNVVTNGITANPSTNNITANTSTNGITANTSKNGITAHTNTNGHLMDISDDTSPPRSDENSEENTLSDASDLQDTSSLLVPQAEILQVRNMKLLLKDSALENDGLISPTRIKNEIIPHCLECNKEQNSSMKEHFQALDRPLNSDIKCGICFLILPTNCALKAHSRIHSKTAPFVCPECGRNFQQWNELYSHMEDVCFHLSKNVRYKCLARKCGKIFAQSITFSGHFPNQHLTRKIVCDICGLTLSSDVEFQSHNKVHDDHGIPISTLECVICTEVVEKPEEHAQYHCQNPDNRIYVYTCKYCKSYYRSKQTYAHHLLRCTKLLLNNQVKREAASEKTEVQCKVLRYCKSCESKIQFHCQYKDVKTVGKNCPQCGSVFGSSPEEIRTLSFILQPKPKLPVKKGSDYYSCILCNTEVKKNIPHHCKYAYPAVVLEKVDQNGTESIEEHKKKRKRVSSPKVKVKKPHVEEIEETIQPIIFNGEYICNVCDYSSKDKSEFREHIQIHRDVSTAYQCMECGECFVVKPSLIKHLQVFHLINNVESYINENECFDKEAVRELEKNMRKIPGESKEPVAENQCKVCREMFSNQLELSKHFRVHGMAFLLRNMIPNK